MKRFFLPGVLVLLFLLHFAAGWRIAETKPSFFYHNDGSEYAEMAESFAETGSMMIAKPRYYEPPRSEPMREAFRPPLLSFFAGLLLRAGLTPSVPYALLQALLSTLASWMMFAVARRVEPSRVTAWIALILYNIHPLVLEYSLQFCSETLFILCVLCFLRVFLEPEENRWKYPLLAAAGALMTLTRPTGLAYLPGGMGVILLYSAYLMWRRAGFRAVFRLRTCRNAAVYGLCFFLLILPCGLRNQALFGKFSLSPFFGGYNLLVGNNRDNLAAYRAGSGKAFQEHQNRGWNAAIRIAQTMPPEFSAKPAEQDAYLKAKALEEIRTMGTRDFLELFFAKALQFVCPWPVRGLHSPLMFWGITLWELFLYAAGAAGIYRFRRRLDILLPFATVFAGGLFAHALVFVSMRYRIPFLDVALILFTATAIRAAYVLLLKKWKGAEE